MEGGEKDAGEEAEVRYREFIIGSLGIGKRSLQGPGSLLIPLGWLIVSAQTLFPVSLTSRYNSNCKLTYQVLT